MNVIFVFIIGDIVYLRNEEKFNFMFMFILF